MESFAEIKLSMYPWPMHEAAITSVPEPCIMIIDDDLDVIEALSTLLKARYRLISCRSFEETENNLSRDINLVLLDIKMAAKDGLEVFGLLKEKHPHLPIIFHSAYPGSSEKVAALERLNHNGHLTKGEYDLSELLRTIEQAMNQPPEKSAVSPKRTPKKRGRKVI